GCVAAFFHEAQGGAEELGRHGSCGIQFEVEGAGDAGCGAGAADLLVDFFGLVESVIGGWDRDDVAAEALASGEARGGVPSGEVRGGGVGRTPAGADGGPHGGVMVAGEGGEILAGSLLNGAEAVEGGGEIFFDGDGGAGSLRQRIKGRID